MNRLENGSAFADGSRRKQSHRAADDRTFIRQDIAESILRHHHIKERRLLNHAHSRIVHIHIIGQHFRITRRHLLRNLTPQPGGSQDISLVYYRQMLSAFHRIFETDFQNTFDFGTGIIIGVIRLVVVLIFLAEIHASRQFANTNEVGVFYQLGTQRRFVQQAFEGLYRTDVRKQSEFLAHRQQSLFGTHLRRRVIVVLRIAHRREQHGICLPTNTKRLFRKRIAGLIDGIRPANRIFVTHPVTKPLTHGTHHLHSLHGDFRPDAVACQYSYFKIHILFLFLCFPVFILQ